MGYYTRFTVSATGDDEALILETLSAESTYSVDSLQGMESIKWYCQHEDCLAMSRHYPEATIRVEGAGEEDGDLWVRWYRDGKYVYYSPRIRLPIGDEPPNGWDNQELTRATCWGGVQLSGRRWYFDTQAELDAEQARGGAFVRTFTMTENLA